MYELDEIEIANVSGGGDFDWGEYGNCVGGVIRGYMDSLSSGLNNAGGTLLVAPPIFMS